MTVKVTFGWLAYEKNLAQRMGLDEEVLIIEAASVRDVLRQVAAMSRREPPETWLNRFFDEQGNLQHLRVILLNQQFVFSQSLDTPLQDGDEVFIAYH